MNLMFASYAVLKKNENELLQLRSATFIQMHNVHTGAKKFQWSIR